MTTVSLVAERGSSHLPNMAVGIGAGEGAIGQGGGCLQRPYTIKTMHSYTLPM